MWILRLILILLGVAFIAGVYFYTRRHPPRRHGVRPTRSEPTFSLHEARMEETRREEPSISFPDHVPEPAIEPEVEREAETEAGLGPVRENRDEVAREVIFSLTLRLSREGVEVSRLLHYLERLGLVLNDQHIYHRIETDGTVAFSVANLFEPGTLHPLPPDSLVQGLNFFFMAVPSAATSSRFERMLGMAYECARAFNGHIEDDQHRPLTAARELDLKLRAAGATAHE